MNKYQEALENIIVYPLKEECENSPCCQCSNECDFYKSKLEDYEVLKELVEKATPKKPTNIESHEKHDLLFVSGKCPVCRDWVNDSMSYCEHCGQKIDWGEEDE